MNIQTSAPTMPGYMLYQPSSRQNASYFKSPPINQTYSSQVSLENYQTSPNPATDGRRYVTSVGSEVASLSLSQNCYHIHNSQAMPPNTTSFSSEAPSTAASDSKYQNISTPPLIPSNRHTCKKTASSRFSPLGIGECSLMGRGPVNEDTIIVEQLDDNCWLFGVFDGHGPCGYNASQLASKYVKKAALEKIEELNISDDGQHANIQDLAIWFQRLFSDIVSEMRLETDRYKDSGTSATVALLLGPDLCLAHVGDSRAILGESQSNALTVTQLTRDHKPSLEDEFARVHAAGGKIDTHCYRFATQDLVVSRLSHPITNRPGIAMSRSLGDLDAAAIGLISDPEVSIYSLPNDGCSNAILMIGSDGLWDFNSQDKLMEQVRSFIPVNASAAAESVCRSALEERSNNIAYLDDTSVIVVYL
eukprot:GHVL01004744.1.p1 GENE.GHVL01004744.1~~GHVL01004744.1.p1  ORF type:complete len:444 (+),score=69.83 GHVL01004744.1:78-1334(+)